MSEGTLTLNDLMEEADNEIIKKPAKRVKVNDPSGPEDGIVVANKLTFKTRFFKSWEKIKDRDMRKDALHAIWQHMRIYSPQPSKYEFIPARTPERAREVREDYELKKKLAQL